MGKVCRGPRSLALLAVLGVVLAASLAGVAGGAGTVGPPYEYGLEVRSSFSVSPRALPKTKARPVTLEVSTEILTTDFYVPPLEELTLELDRAVTVDTRDLQVCGGNSLVSQTPGSIEKECKEALVGRGQAKLQIDFEEWPVKIEAPMLIYNGGIREGAVKLYGHFFITVPIPAQIVISIEVKRSGRGRYGSRMTATIPKIAGGSGSITSLTMKINRRYTHEGKRVGVASARCPNGALRMKAQARFPEDLWAADMGRRCAAER